MLVRRVIDWRGAFGCCSFECVDEVSTGGRSMHGVASQQLMDDGDQARR
jgi:hypothetical protein